MAETSARLQVPVRTTWIIRSSAVNAVAYVQVGELAFTEKMVDTFSDEEIRAICAHELGHLSEGPWTRIGRLVGSLAYFPVIFFNVAKAHGSDGFALMAVAYFAISRSARYLSRRMENRADRVAAAADSAENGSYARALEHVYELNLTPATLPRPKAGTHPGLYDRLVAVGATPAYARPRPPREWSWTSFVGLTTAALLALSYFVD